jgi:hypothetical protein
VAKHKSGVIYRFLLTLPPLATTLRKMVTQSVRMGNAHAGSLRTRRRQIQIQCPITAIFYIAPLHISIDFNNITFKIHLNQNTLVLGMRETSLCHAQSTVQYIKLFKHIWLIIKQWYGYLWILMSALRISA